MTLQEQVSATAGFGMPLPQCRGGRIWLMAGNMIHVLGSASAATRDYR